MRQISRIKSAISTLVLTLNLLCSVDVKESRHRSCPLYTLKQTRYLLIFLKQINSTILICVYHNIILLLYKIVF